MNGWMADRRRQMTVGNPDVGKEGRTEERKERTERQLKEGQKE